jgi:hypothetical protein
MPIGHVVGMVKRLIASMSIVIATVSVASAQDAELQSTTPIAVTTALTQALASTTLPPAIEPVASVTEEQPKSSKRTPWGITAIAVAAPIADGFSTYWAMKQSGPHARVGESNGFYHQLFGSDVKPGEILGFKIGQAALMGVITHFAPESHRARTIVTATMSAVLHGFASTINIKNGRAVRRFNAMATVELGR